MMVLVDGCDKAENMGRKAIHKSGDLVGKGATEFFSGVGEGVDAVKWKGPDVLSAISTRKSIRKFDASKPVEDDKDIPDSFVVNDGVEVGIGNKIPLWLFGFLY